MPGRPYDPDEERAASNPVVLRYPAFQTMFTGAYKQGEHIAIVGPTGGGKTMLGLELCKMVGARRGKDGRPSRVTVLAYKPRDDTMRQILPEKEWPIIKKWPPAYGQEHCIIWVRGGRTTAERTQRQRAVFIPVLDEMYVEGGQTVYIPEAAHFERKPPDGLGMGGKMTEFWSTARSNKLAVISDTQRPRMVTLSMWTEPSWVMIFRPEDEEDVKRVAQLSGAKVAVWRNVYKLGDYEFLCIRRQRGSGRGIYVSRVDI